MKTLTLVCNFVLLGLVGVEILTSDFPRESGSFIFVIAIAGIILNILMISGSSMVEIKPSGGFISNAKQIRWSFYLFLKIFAITLNSILLVLALIESRGGSGYLIPYLFAFIIITILVSIVRITLSKWNRFAGLKRTTILTGTFLFLLLTGTLSTFLIMIRNGVKENISIAKKEYPGKAEDALLAYLADSTKSPRERTEIAVWTLGQIRSGKALPVLKSLYKNDPEGKTCRHDSELCQYEIHKAILSIERNGIGIKEKRIFGWSGLNK
ncbi:MAG: HEAT repeat domain-containing protein [Methanococcaceae archaeon]